MTAFRPFRRSGGRVDFDLGVELVHFRQFTPEDGEQSFMGNELFNLFRRISAGVYVIGVGRQAQRNAFTAAWLMQDSFKPLLLALSINPAHSSYALLKEGRVFVVNVLGRGQIELARHFGTPSETDKLTGIAWHTGLTGAPILKDALAYFDCKLVDTHPAGDHLLAIGEVVDGALLAPDATPMSYTETGNLDGSNELYPASFQ